MKVTNLVSWCAFNNDDEMFCKIEPHSEDEYKLSIEGLRDAWRDIYLTREHVEAIYNALEKILNP